MTARSVGFSFRTAWATASTRGGLSLIHIYRLLCGDVGYGKTEVAFRAMMKCVLDGKQAAILVPTTVLARQHYLTAPVSYTHLDVYKRQASAP